MWQLTPYTIPLAAATALGAISTILVWRQRDSRADNWAMLVQLSITLWALLQLLSLSGTTLEWQSIWFQLFIPIKPLLTVCLLCFTCYYTGRGEWFTRPRRTLLYAFPVGVLVLSLTNGSHEFVLVDPNLTERGGYVLLQYGWGPVFYVYSLVAYALVLVALAWLFLKVVRSRNVYRSLSLVLFVSILALSVPTVVSALGVSPLAHYTLLPFVYLAISLVLVGVTQSVRVRKLFAVDRLVTTFSSRFGSLVPLARDFVLEEIDNGIVVFDTNGRVVDVNGTAKRMLGVDRAVGRSVSEIIDHDRVTDAGTIRPILEGDRDLYELQDEVTIDVASGSRCYDVTVSELTDSEGDTAGYVALLYDVTDRKRRERILRQREQELERRTNELESQTTKLEHQNEQLDRFAGVVSHDLRNPLNVATGYLESASAQTDDDAGAVTVDVQTIDQVSDSLERMNDIIDDALTLARQGKAITETEPVTLSAVAREAWTNVETDDVALVCDCDRSIRADRDRLLNVFENLFRNSIEHGARSGGSGTDTDADLRTITVGILEDGSGFYVEDDGGGIPAAHRDAVFDHGYSTSDAGTGFGLTIVRDIARAHGWSVAVTDADSGGARFECTGVSST